MASAMTPNQVREVLKVQKREGETRPFGAISDAPGFADDDSNKRSADYHEKSRTEDA